MVLEGSEGSPNATYKNMQYRLDKSCSALAETQLRKTRMHSSSMRMLYTLAYDNY